jgi:Bacterial protein of unknown function (DUF885).
VRRPARPGPPGRIGGADRAPDLAVRAAGEADGHGGFADPRIGPELFARKLSLTLSASADADAILARAEADLDRVSEQITELAAQIAGAAGPGVVRQVLDRLAGDVPADATILEFCRDALAAQTAFVTDRRLITVYDDPIELIPMPEIDRGVAVAYCDSPGPLEPAPLPTFIAVSPTPADWTPERVASFYREYNRHMVHNLMVHEAMPGHYLQLQHSRRFTGSTPRSGRRCGPARSPRAGPPTPNGSWRSRSTRARTIRVPCGCSSSRCSCG